MSRRPSSTKKMITEIMIFNRIKFRYIRIMQNDYIIRLRTYRAEEPYIFRSAAHYGITNDSPDQAELLFPFHSHHSTFVFNPLAITLHHHSFYIYIYQITRTCAWAKNNSTRARAVNYLSIRSALGFLVYPPPHIHTLAGPKRASHTRGRRTSLVSNEPAHHSSFATLFRLVFRPPLHTHGHCSWRLAVYMRNLMYSSLRAAVSEADPIGRGRGFYEVFDGELIARGLTNSRRSLGTGSM